MNLGASMRYSPSGKRRKTNAWTTKKRKPTFESRPVKPDQATLNRIKASASYGTAAGKWSARKAQALARLYKKRGGGYRN